jgi:hypothetical protein
MAELRRLQSVAAPNLPIAPVNYSPQHYDVLNNALRLYFNRLDQNLTALFNNLGGKYLNTPYITAYDTTDQYATASNTPTKVAWNTGTVNGFRLLSGAAYADQTGTYKIDYSLQLANTANAAHDVYVWLRVNGVDVVGSASKFTLPARKSNGTPSFLVAYSHITYEMNTNDYVELWWATDQAYSPVGPVDGVYIEFEAAQTVPYARPSVPSSIGTITFVSAPQA